MPNEQLEVEVYKDLAQPSARHVGSLVGRAVSLALAPLRGVVWGFERVEAFITEALSKKLENQNPENIVAPPLHVAGPIYEALRFSVGIPALQEMFANLLAASMIKGQAERAHPSFVEVVKQLSPDEALILERIGRATQGFSLSEEFTSMSSTVSIESQFETFCVEAKVQSLGQAGTYLDNLLRLRILAETQISESEYQPEGDNDYGDYGAHVENTHSKLIQVTPFGQTFIDVCAKAPA